MTSDSSPTALPPSPVATVIEAIQQKLCLNTVYNRDKVVLAPHILYMRHGEPFVDAVTVARNGMLPREIKVGTFKLSGLGALAITGRTFVPHRQFAPEAEKYVGSALVTVETAATAAA